jgi:tetratricopeptide (TPR) repeat protein
MRNLNSRKSRAGQAVAGALLLTAMSGLQSVNAHQYTALIDAKKYAEVETAVAATLAIEPNNADALLGSIDLILLENNIKRFDDAAKMAEQCIAHHPKNSECHEALGNVLGSKAERGDIMDAVGSLGTIRDAFKTAIALDPTNYNAAMSLTSFYLEVPGLMGGSTSSAKKLIRTAEKSNPEAAKLLQAKFDLSDEEFEKASAGALAANTDHNTTLVKLQRDLLVQIGLTLNREKQFADAEKILLAVVQRHPDYAPAYLGLGRSLLEQGKPQDALLSLEKSLQLDATAAVHYRLGQTWQALGDNTKAVSAFEQALAFTPALTAKSREDVEDQLKALKNPGFGTK